jgi:hypothetical protein
VVPAGPGAQGLVRHDRDTPPGIFRAGLHDPVKILLVMRRKVFAVKKFFAVTLVPTWQLMHKSGNIRI